MKKFPYIQTSVFIDDRYSFSGNQLATFWDSTTNNILKTEEMQGIALEMNFSESTFIFDPTHKKCSKKVRIFTPRKELRFAGHPTLGTAFVLREKGIIAESMKKTVLELGVGPIEVQYLDNNEIGMVQPKPQFLEEFKDKDVIAQILGLKEKDILDKFPMQAISTGFPFLIVPIKDLEAIGNISLNPQMQIEQLSKFITPELLVFTTETEHANSSVHVRMFAPSAGVLEDPATGSAAGPLCAYLEKWLVLDKQKLSEKITIEQGFEISRPSKLIGHVNYEKDEMNSILISGKVKKTAEGMFFL